jgi:predicted hydrocarbon binding protein
MSEETRAKIATEKSGFNQLRNSVYFLQRYMKQHNFSTADIIDRYNRMGKNIGHTIARELHQKPTDPMELLTSLYDFILYSKVKITKNQNLLCVEDPSCALCKYKYPDIDVPGCNVAIGMMTEILSQYGYSVTKSVVEKSKAWGDSVCMHTYEVTKHV